MMTTTQTTRLLAWVIAGLIVVGILLYFFGPVEMRTEEIIAVSLIILGLICFLVWLRGRGHASMLISWPEIGRWLDTQEALANDNRRS